MTVYHGRRGAVTAIVSVTVSPFNEVPTVTKTVGNPNATTGVVTGTVKGTDGDRGVISYATAQVPAKGTVTISATGAFTYTPTDAARVAATAPNASAATKTESIVITVTDRYGGNATFGLVTPIAPYPSGNRPPTNVQNTPTGSSSAIGTVTGTVSATDPEGDPLTYTVTGGPTKGVVTLNLTTGAYSCTPPSRPATPRW